MNIESGTRTPAASPRRRLEYPLHQIVAVVIRTEVEGAIAALVDAGILHDQIDVITADVVEGLDEPIGGSGLRRLLVLLLWSIGDDLDELEEARQELRSGYTLIHVRIDGDDERARAQEALIRHGVVAMHYFGQWTVTSLVAHPATTEKLRERFDVR